MFFISAFIAGFILAEIILICLTNGPAYTKPLVDIWNKPSIAARSRYGMNGLAVM